MNAIYIALNVIKINFRDKKVLLSMMLFPMILILILGSALKSSFSVKDLGKTTVCYLNSDNKEASKSFDEFLKNKEIKKILEVKNVKTYSEGKKLVNDGKVTAMIYIDDSYTENYQNNKKSKIKIYQNEKSTVRNGIVKSVIDSYNDAANTIMTTAKLTKGRTSYVESNNVNENYISVEGKSPRAIDYYSVTMLVLILMYGANYGATEIQNLFYDHIGKRIKSTGTKTFQHLVGVVLGVVFTLLIQALVLVLFTKYVYGANWGDNPLIIIGVMAAMSIFSTAMGILFMAFTGDDKKATALIGVVTPILTVISGGYFKIPGLSDGVIAKCIPNGLAQSALFNSVYGGSTSDAWQSVAIILIMAAVILAASSFFARRKLA